MSHDKKPTDTAATGTGISAEKPAILYLNYRQRLTATRLATVSFIVVISFLMDGLFEALYRPDAFRASFVVRIAVGVTAALLGILAWKVSLRSWGLPLAIALGFLVAIDIASVQARTGGFSSPYYAGYVLLLVGGATLIPATALEYSVFTIAIWSVYVGVGVLSERSDRVSTLSNIFFLGTASFISLVVAASIERLRRKEFIGAHLLSVEKERSRQLLDNILPSPIADRLLAGEEPIADEHSEVTVLFADVVGFTPLSARMTPEETVELLNAIFSGMDRMTEERGLEKIKTIGDAYMVAGGIPSKRPDHADAVADLAIAFLSLIERFHERGCHLRIGIHSGPVVAGVIGKTTFSYDLWGDTVNTASRMESHGLPDRIQVTRAVKERLSGRFLLTRRGTIEIKGKGPMETWFLETMDVSIPEG